MIVLYYYIATSASGIARRNDVYYYSVNSKGIDMDMTQQVQSNIRLPEELYESIKRLAEEQVRSINGQIVVLLRDAIAQQEGRAQNG